MVPAVAETPNRHSNVPEPPRGFSALVIAATLSMLASCADDQSLQRRPRKFREAFCEANVIGVGIIDVENDYLPHVVHCENGGAPFAALKAQAVAARSYLYYKLQTRGAIEDGQQDQVYSCAGSPTAEQVLAVSETSGQVLTFAGATLCAFYVAGAKQSRPACVGNTDHYTERFITHNWGLAGSDLHQTPLGLIHPDNQQNRGCMSQWGARCLAEEGWMYRDILAFYYGADFTLETAVGPCIVPSNQPPRGELTSVSCSDIRGWAQDPDDPDASIDVQLWFDGNPGSVHTPSTVARTVAQTCRNAPCAPTFTARIPLGLRDGRTHSVIAVAIDTDGGVDARLDVISTSFRCDPPAPAFATARAVRRPMSLETLYAWQFSVLEDVVVLTPAELAEYPLGPPVPEYPDWVNLKGGVGAVDTGTLRLLPEGSLAAWRLASRRAANQADLAHPHAMPFPVEPYLVRANDDSVFLIDYPFWQGSE